MGCDSVEPYFVEFRDVSPLKEVVVYRRGVEVVENSVDKDKLSSESSILDLLQEGIVES
ncbi:MAG: hypothetical protein GY849_00915 [Deltaproteobacteria bacterium]|nr:hypothetical protein [Deltaproteobacteria bacterium]